jgi:hypothetical protein
MELLIDVFENMETFHTSSMLDFPHEQLCKLKGFSQPLHCVENKMTFLSNWGLFTMGMFLGVDWNNIFVAGGAVLGPLLPSKLLKYVG